MAVYDECNGWGLDRLVRCPGRANFRAGGVFAGRAGNLDRHLHVLGLEAIPAPIVEFRSVGCKWKV